MFPEQDGAYLDARNWRRRVRDPVLKEAKVSACWPHVARHTYTTQQLQRGASLAWLKEQSWHSSIQVTVDVYGHLAIERLQIIAR